MNREKPVRGFHLRFGSHELVEPFKLFIEKVLAPKGINHLIIECNTSFVFESHPEVKGGAFTKEDAKGIADLCRSLGIRVIPLFQCLGHQGWGGAPNSLLKAHPEFDETPNVPLDAKWPEIFCRSWCPSHPDVNALVFDLMDEIIDAFEADAFHVGMDEVYVLADDNCPRCKGKSRAELFAKAVRDMYGHVVKDRGIEMWMWADRLNDSKKMGYDEWEGDTFGTHEAIDYIPTDITLVDWHYEKREGFPSIGNLLAKGFDRVLPACWYDTGVALFLLEESVRQAKERNAVSRMPGMVVTSWNQWDKDTFDRFIQGSDALQGNVQELYETLSTLTNELK